ncbi:unnamed protein product [Moneuplotes crassus]|uniref:Cyclic nucleotide-binding domain-containing protein n=1 Tax=Euplotes crassus TaxID=5936 RepID=A0AAD1XI46_EUPCR|nr:unnamed protein product [Moneuplotes crassus]
MQKEVSPIAVDKEQKESNPEEGMEVSMTPSTLSRHKIKVLALASTLILKKKTIDRTPEDLNVLYDYFCTKSETRKAVQFFEKCKEENGEATVRMLCKVLHYQKNPAGDKVINYGEIGSKFYIILKGEVAVRVPAQIQRAGTLRQILEFLMTDYEWITDNELLQRCLAEINKYFPFVIRKESAEKLALNLNKCKKYYDRIPDFEDDELGSKEREFKFNSLIDVIHLKDGSSFGELALINNTPRSATIVTLTETHFATMNKDDFKRMLGKAMRKKFVKMIRFMENFIFFKQISRLALEKFALYFSKCEVKRGNEIMKEQEDANFVYFIEEGEFEVSKTIWFEKDSIEKGTEGIRDKYKADFLRYSTVNCKPEILNLIDQATQMVFSNEDSELQRFKKNHKEYKKQRTEKISIIGSNETVGLIEAVLDCPYYASTVTCVSSTGVYHRINKEDLFRKVDIAHPGLLQLVKQKLFLISKTTSKFLEVQRTLRRDFGHSKASSTSKLSKSAPRDQQIKYFKYEELAYGPKKNILSLAEPKSSNKSGDHNLINSEKIESFLKSQKKGRKRLFSINKVSETTNQITKDLERSKSLIKSTLSKSPMFYMEPKSRKNDPMPLTASPMRQMKTKKGITLSKIGKNQKKKNLIQSIDEELSSSCKVSMAGDIKPNYHMSINSFERINLETPYDRIGATSSAFQEDVQISKAKIYNLPFKITANIEQRSSTFDTRNQKFSFNQYGEKYKIGMEFQTGVKSKHVRGLKTINYSEQISKRTNKNRVNYPHAILHVSNDYREHNITQRNTRKNNSIENRNGSYSKNISLINTNERIKFPKVAEICKSQSSTSHRFNKALKRRNLLIERIHQKNFKKLGRP